MPETPVVALPDRPPFRLRARLISPLGDGSTLNVDDGLVAIDAAGLITSVGPFADASEADLTSAIDIRPLVVMPGLVDLHAHLPQVANAGLGYGLTLLSWLDRLTFPTERSWADPAVAEAMTPAVFRAFAAAGTTTIVGYGVVYAAAMDAAFRAAEAHGTRAILGKVMMDRLTYDGTIEPSAILDRSLAESRSLAERWHGAADGRLGYAVTPRFALSCTAELLRESASLARDVGCWWQTHVSEDRDEIVEVRRLFPEATDYVDVYDRAGGLGPRSILGHAIHLSEREQARLRETDTRVAHCPTSNLFIGAGIMPLAQRLAAGLVVGLGSDVSGGAELSLFGVMRTGAYSQQARASLLGETRAVLGPLDWLRLGTLDGARALGLDESIGSIEVDKEADLIAVDPARTAPLDADGGDDIARLADPELLVSRLIFRADPSMVRAAWVRGHRLEGPS